jgi:hypothetical protein
LLGGGAGFLGVTSGPAEFVAQAANSIASANSVSTYASAPISGDLSSFIRAILATLLQRPSIPVRLRSSERPFIADILLALFVDNDVRESERPRHGQRKPELW